MDITMLELRELFMEPSVAPGNGLYIGVRVIARTQSAGVFLGTLAHRDGAEIVLHDCRRLWRWAGATEVSQLAQDGVSKPLECKFPQSVPEVLLLNAIEIIPATERACASIDAVPVWRE